MKQQTIQKPSFMSWKWKFPAPYEKQFEMSCAENSAKITRVVASNSIALNIGWLLIIAPRFQLPTADWPTIRFYSMILVALNLAHFALSYVPPRFGNYVQLTTAIGAGIFAPIIGKIAMCYPLIYNNLFFTALVIVLFANYVVIGLRVKYAVICGMVYSSTFLTSDFFAHIYPELPRGRLLGALYVYVAHTVGFIGAYLIELQQRRGFVDMILLSQERDRSNELILNILPEKVAEQLKTSTEGVAEDFSDVSVMFADLVGFSAFASMRPAAEVRNALHNLFSEFDQIALGMGVEKIKTIGDSYMAASGIPAIQADHATRMLRFATAIQIYAQRYFEVHLLPLNLRIGIHSGPVSAGIVGKTKFTYDLWGDTVNAASRLEANAGPGEIMISAACRDAAGNDFQIIDNGILDLKGIGQMHTFKVVLDYQNPYAFSSQPRARIKEGA